MRRTFLCPCLLLILACCTASLAAQGRERTEVGHRITIGPDEEVSEATCFGCSVHVKGHVAGDVTTFGGSIILEEHGQIDGDATAFGGDIRLEHQVKVNGDVTAFAGRLRRDPEATIGGDVTTFGGGGWMVLFLIIPLVLFGFLVAGIVWLIRRLLRPSPLAA